MSKNLKISFYILLVICFMSFIASVILIISNVRKESKIIADAKQSSLKEVKRSAEQVDALLKKIEKTANSVSRASSEIKNTAFLHKRFSEILKTDLGIVMVCVAFAPYRHDLENRLYAPSAQMIEDNILFFQMEGDGDYTETSWYKDTVAGGIPVWSEPSMEDKINSCTVSYNVPFYLPGEEKGIAGVVHFAILLSSIREYASSMELGNAILRFIISKKGLFVYYPLNEVVENRINILDAVKTMKDHILEEKIRRVLSGENISFESREPGSNSTYMSFYEHIPSTGWCIAGSYLLEQFTLSETLFRRQQIQLILALIVFITTVTALLSRAYLLNKLSLWCTSIVFTFMCLAGTLYIWSIVYTAPVKQENDRIFLTDKVKIQKALSKYEAFISKTHMKRPIRIPTGIYLQSLEYLTSNDLKAVGYVWLKFPTGNKDVVINEPTFPEATSIEMKEVSRRNSEEYDVIRWRFELTLRENFDYSKYPLDRPDIWIWIKSGDFEKREVLIPDLGSYKATSPQNGPGLPESGFVLPGYTLLASYFDYRESIATTDFGVQDTRNLETFPELYYHVVGKRNVLNPLVSKVFPLLIILSMLFVVKLKFTSSEEDKRTFGLSGIAVLGTVISFFFSTLLSQSSFRTEVNVERITFMENFHLITYLMLFYMSVTTFFYIGKQVPSILEYEDCLLSKILYWPLITGLVLISTIIYYY